MLHFAIVIPNLNQSHFLPDALDSLKSQSVPFNLAVMDGGSTDHFNQAVQEYVDIIAFMRSRPDGGQARAIADGIEMISGDIISWLNADDYYFPGVLDKVVSVFEKHPEIDVVYGDAIHVKPDGAFMSYFPAIQEFDAKKLPYSCYICQPTCFVRRSAYEAAGGINPALKYTMDWDLWCRLAANGVRFKYLHDVLAAVRYYPETKTLSGDKRRYREIWRIGKKYSKRFIPILWLGFYRYDLTFKQKKTLWEKVVFNILEWTRYIKKRLLKEDVDTLYGFYRWKSVVDRQCIIQLPLYGNRKIQAVYIRVSPGNMDYLIEINSNCYKKLSEIDGRIRIELPQLSEPYLCIKVTCQEGHVWELTDFYFDNSLSI